MQPPRHGPTECGRLAAVIALGLCFAAGANEPARAADAAARDGDLGTLWTVGERRGVTLRLYRHRSSVEFAEFDWSAANAR